MSQSELMRSRRFAPLFYTQFLGAFNDNVFRFALIIFVAFTVAERTGMESRMLVVLTGGIFVLPFFLFSALAGQIADRYEKSNLIRRIKTAEIFVMGLGAVGFWLQDLYFLLTVLFLMGAQSTFFGPLKYGILPQHLEEAELTGGNGLIQMGTYVAILVGGVSGGMLAGVDDLGPGLVIAFVVSLAVLGRIAAGFIPTAPPSAATMQIDFNPVRSTWRILADAARGRDVFTIILLISGFWFVGATYLSVVPSIGKELLNADEQAVTLLNAAFTVGIGAGSLACERLSRGRIELGLVAPAALGLALASFDVFIAGAPKAPSDTLNLTTFFTYGPAVRTFVDLTLIGACGALFIVPLYASLQARVAGRHCARMLAALNITNALFMVVSALFTMGLYRLGVSIPGVFLVVGVMIITAMAAAVAVMPEIGQRARAVLLRQ
jgi:hypothetical protein